MSIGRRRFLALPAAALAAQQAPKDKRPNILVFMSDQESAMLPGPASLPNRKRIIDRAASFTDAFCNTPQCSPARSTLLTGNEPHTTGVLTNVDGTSLGKGLKVNMPSIGQVFRDAGYNTAYFGKWHLGGGKDLRPFGWESFASEVPDAEAAEQAASWIKDQHQGPWLVWVSVLDPHHIYDIPRRIASTKIREGVKPPSSTSKNLATKPTEQQAFIDKDQGQQTRDFTERDWLKYRSYYLELVEKADSYFGQVLDAVADSTNTVITYTADHGDALGEHGLPYKGPFMYEPLIRIPFMIAGPGISPGVRDDMVTQADLAPTLASLAGVKWPAKVDGRDLTMTRTRDAVFLEYFAKQKWVNPIRTIRTNRWKLNWYDSGHQELYDLTADPSELKNLATDKSHAGIKAELEARLNSWRGPMM